MLQDETITCDGGDVSRTGFTLLWQQRSRNLLSVKEGVVQPQRLRGKYLQGEVTWVESMEKKKKIHINKSS